MAQFYPITSNNLCPQFVDMDFDYSLGGLNNVTVSPIVVAGDTLIFITGGDGESEATGNAWTAPAGALAISGFPYTGTGWAPNINAWSKTATAADSGAVYSFGKINSGAQTSFVIILKNVNALTPGPSAHLPLLNGNPGTLDQASSSIAPCGISLVAGFVQNNNQLLSPPSGYTEQANTTPSYRGGVLGLQTFPGPGSTGIRTWSVGTAGNNAFSVTEVIVT